MVVKTPYLVVCTKHARDVERVPVVGPLHQAVDIIEWHDVIRSVESDTTTLILTYRDLVKEVRPDTSSSQRRNAQGIEQCEEPHDVISGVVSRLSLRY